MEGKEINSNVPVKEKKETHCQLSPVGLLAVFTTGIAFQTAVTATTTSSLVIATVCILVNVLCFSIDIQRLRGGGYTRDSLGFWRPDASIKPDAFKKK